MYSIITVIGLEIFLSPTVVQVIVLVSPNIHLPVFNDPQSDVLKKKLKGTMLSSEFIILPVSDTTSSASVSRVNVSVDPEVEEEFPVQTFLYKGLPIYPLSYYLFICRIYV